MFDSRIDYADVDTVSIVYYTVLYDLKNGKNVSDILRYEVESASQHFDLTPEQSIQVEKSVIEYVIGLLSLPLPAILQKYELAVSSPAFVSVEVCGRLITIHRDTYIETLKNEIMRRCGK